MKDIVNYMFRSIISKAIINIPCITITLLFSDSLIDDSFTVAYDGIMTSLCWSDACNFHTWYLDVRQWKVWSSNINQNAKCMEVSMTSLH